MSISAESDQSCRRCGTSHPPSAYVNTRGGRRVQLAVCPACLDDPTIPRHTHILCAECGDLCPIDGPITYRNLFCAPCAQQRDRAFRRTYRQQPAEKRKRLVYHVATRYGLSAARYDALMDQQGGRCAVCGGPPTGQGRLHVDHDHATSLVRGLLCHDCNTGIGSLKDDLSILRAAVAYLERQSGR